MSIYTPAWRLEVLNMHGNGVSLTWRLQNEIVGVERCVGISGEPLRMTYGETVGMRRGAFRIAICIKYDKVGPCPSILNNKGRWSLYCKLHAVIQGIQGTCTFLSFNNGITCSGRERSIQQGLRAGYVFIDHLVYHRVSKAHHPAEWCQAIGGDVCYI